MNALASWCMLLAVITPVVAWVIHELRHPLDADAPEDDFTLIERTDLLLWDGETRGEW